MPKLLHNNFLREFASAETLNANGWFYIQTESDDIERRRPFSAVNGLPSQTPAAGTRRRQRGKDLDGVLANPEKSGDAKLRDCRAPGLQSGGAMFAGPRAKQGKPCDAKVRGLIRKPCGMAARPPDTLHPTFCKERKNEL